MIQDGVPEWRSFERNCGSDVQGRTIFVIVHAQCVGGTCAVWFVCHTEGSRDQTQIIWLTR